MKIFYWSGGYHDGCTVYRCLIPAAALSKFDDIEVHVAAWWKDEYVGKGDGWLKPDVLVGQRVCKDGTSQEWQKRSDIFKVYELDDDLLNVHPTNPVYGYFSQTSVKRNIIENIRAADRVTVSTAALADRVSEYHDDVVVVPNSIPERVFEIQRPRNPEVTIGWHGSPSHAQDWFDAAPQIKRYLKRNPNVHYHEIGAQYISADQSLNASFTNWLSVSDMWESIDFDIGVAPLRPNIFNKSKSAIKALEYAALGIPIVASNFGPYADFVEHGETGYLVKQDYLWNTFLGRLVTSPTERAKLGHAAKERARAYTAEKVVHQWKAALCSSKTSSSQVSPATS